MRRRRLFEPLEKEKEKNPSNVNTRKKRRRWVLGKSEKEKCKI